MTTCPPRGWGRLLPTQPSIGVLLRMRTSALVHVYDVANELRMSENGKSMGLKIGLEEKQRAGDSAKEWHLHFIM